MILRTPSIEVASIVLLGSFNPAIIQPRWLAGKSLIRPEEAQLAESDANLVISRDLAVVRLPWLDLQVLGDRLTATTSDPSHFETLLECVTGIFQYLEFTPVTGMGVNCSLHWQFEDTAMWPNLEEALVPRDLWNGILQGHNDDLPRMRSLSLRGQRQGSPADHLNVKVEPSARIPHGLYFHTNEHFSFPADTPAVEPMSILRNNWTAALDNTRVLAENLIQRTTNA